MGGGVFLNPGFDVKIGGRFDEWSAGFGGDP
jgi:hypothetical protein